MSILERYRQRRAEKDHSDVEKKAADLFQVQEFSGEIWLTYSGNLVCPCSLLTKEPVEALKVMRELYVKRTPKICN